MSWEKGHFQSVALAVVVVILIMMLSLALNGCTSAEKYQDRDFYTEQVQACEEYIYMLGQLAAIKDTLTPDEIARVEGARPQMNEDCTNMEPDFRMMKRLELGNEVMRGVYDAHY